MISFAIPKKSVSHTAAFHGHCFDYVTEGEPCGQLVRCLSGEIELLGHAGEWIIPSDHMVYIPSDRMFRVRARRAASVQITRFCSREVSWKHDGCWVGEVGEFAQRMLTYAQKWGEDVDASDHQAQCFFVTLGEVVSQ
ncbi:MAG: hypothetical protein V7695_22395 [Sulfitobacter sp.]